MDFSVFGPIRDATKGKYCDETVKNCGRRKNTIIVSMGEIITTDTDCESQRKLPRQITLSTVVYVTVGLKFKAYFNISNCWPSVWHCSQISCNLITHMC